MGKEMWINRWLWGSEVLLDRAVSTGVVSYEMCQRKRWRKGAGQVPFPSLL